MCWSNAAAHRDDIAIVIRYLGIFIVQSRTFKCFIDEVKRSFYKAANAIFGKIGIFASDEVTLHQKLHFIKSYTQELHSRGHSYKLIKSRFNTDLYTPTFFEL